MMNSRLFYTLILGVCLVYGVDVSAQATETAVKSLTRSKNSPNLNDLPIASDRAADLMAQETPLQDQVTEVTGVSIESTATGIEIKLETSAGSTLTPVTQVDGNTVVIDIENTVLALPAGQPFRQNNPATGITEVTVSQVEPTKVQVRVKGTESVPIATVVTGTEGLVLAITSADENEEEITAIGQRSALTERFQSPSPKVVIDQADIERFNHGTLGDVLKRLPGVTFSGPPDENRDIRLRGLPEGFTQILFDGQSLPDERNGRQVQVNRIPASLIERVEIIRNPTAVQNSQGIGGTVNVIFKTPQERVSNLSVGISTLESQGPYGELDFLYGDKVGDFSYLLSASVQTRGSVKFKDRRARNLQDVITQTDIEDDIKAFRDISIAPRFEWKPSSKDTLRFEPFILLGNEQRDVNRDVTNFNFFGNGRLQRQRLQQRISDEERNTTNWRLKSSWERQLSDTATMQLGLSVQGLNTDFNKSETVTTTDTNFANSPNAVGVVGSPSESLNTEATQIDETEVFPTLRFDWQVSSIHRLTLGADTSFRDRKAAKTAQDIANPKDSFELQETQVNLYVQDEIKLGSAHTVTAGARLELLTATATDFFGRGEKRSNSNLNPSLHYRYQISPSLVLRASMARTVARPAFNQLIPFGNSRQGNISQPDEFGNPDLRPQTAWGFDVGLEKQFGNGTGLIGINGFFRLIDSLIENQITLNPANSRFEQRPINIGSARAYGVELDARTRMGIIGLPGLTLIGNISVIGSEVEDPFTGETRRFREQPPYIFNVGFDYTTAKPWLSFGLNYNFRPRINTSELAGNVIQVTDSAPLHSLDAYLKFNFTKAIALSFYGRNLIPIQEIRPRQFFDTSGFLLSTQSDDQRSERAFGVNLSWQF